MENYLLIKYFEKKCNSPEMEEVENWISLSDENRKTFQKVKEIWETSQKAPETIQLDYKKAWGKIKSGTGIKDEVSKQFRLNPLLRIAAALLVLISIAALVNQLYFKTPELITETNPNLPKKEIHLNDGTTVILNRNSQLTYPEHFDNKTRELSLEGEAFFKVAKDRLHPFIVHTRNTMVRVLGTSFNINGKDSEKVVVSVLEGKVAFKTENKEGKQIQLTKGERGIYEKNSKQLNKTLIADENFLSWKTGILSFNNQKLGDAIEVLSEYYSKKIEVQPELLDRPITVTFDNQSFDEVLEILEMTLHIQIEKRNSKIYLEIQKNN